MFDGDDFILTPLVREDAHSLNHLMASNNSRFRRYFPVTLSQTLSAVSSQAYILRKQREKEDKTGYTFAIKEKNAPQVIGLVIIKEIEWENGQGELAYCIAPEYEGRGWISRAVQLVSEYSLKELGLQTLQIIVHKSNVGSVRVAEKSGYLWIKTLPKSFTPPGEPAIDMELYELIQ